MAGKIVPSPYPTLFFSAITDKFSLLYLLDNRNHAELSNYRICGVSY